ncbi:unnamed protein product, partial [Brassica rapa]
LCQLACQLVSNSDCLKDTLRSWLHTTLDDIWFLVSPYFLGSSYFLFLLLNFGSSYFLFLLLNFGSSYFLSSLFHCIFRFGSLFHDETWFFGPLFYCITGFFN